MRKILALVLCLLLVTAPTFAEGQISITQKNLYVFDSGSLHPGYLFAKVENLGDEALAVGRGKLVIFDKNDEVTDMEEYINTSPNRIVLDPGEYAYVREYSLFDVSSTSLGDYKLSMGTETKGTKAVKLSCESSFEIRGSDSFDNYAYVTFTNTTAEIQYGLGIVVALMDVDGNLLFVDATSLDNTAVHPGSTITRRIYIDRDFIEYYESNDIKPSSVDAIVYCSEV